MAEYFNLINDNNEVVIDDKFFIPMLIYRGKYSTNIHLPPVTQWIKMRFYTHWEWVGRLSLGRKGTMKELGLVPRIDQTPDMDEQKLTEVRAEAGRISKLFITCARTDVPNTGVSGRLELISYWVDNNTRLEFELLITFQSRFQGTPVELAIYCMDSRVLRASNIGFQIFHDTGEVLFDAFRGVFQVIGVMNGGVDVWKNPAATYVFQIPKIIDKKDVFVSCRSGLPYFSAYRIHNSGVDWNYTSFEPRLEFTQDSLIVRLMRQKDFGGSNSAYGYGGYFENVVYCMQPEGIYL